MGDDTMALPATRIRVLSDPAAVAAAAVEIILASAAQAVGAFGRFRMVLAGGSTPEAAYRLLAAQQADWTRWHLYLGDERCLPPEDEARNSRMAEQAWLGQVPVPSAQFHPIPAELGAETGAARYAALVAAALPFDLVLLGMGEDGHTASLFPGHPLPSPGPGGPPLVLPVHGAPKPPPDRVSLSPTALTRAGLVLVLVTGAGKGDALRRWQQGEALPVAGVTSASRSLVLLDRAAADAAGLA